MNLTESTRAYVYRCLVALSLLAVGLGYIAEQEAALWLGVAAAVLGNGLAAVNTTTSRD